MAMRTGSSNSSSRPGSKFSSKPGFKPRRPGQGGGGKRRPFLRKKICRFCSEKVQVIDFKEIEILRRFLTEKGKIIPRRTTGNCAKCQRRLVRAIKRSRHAALLAFQEV